MLIPYLQTALNNWDLGKKKKSPQVDKQRDKEGAQFGSMDHAWEPSIPATAETQGGWRKEVWGTDSVPIAPGGRKWGGKKK